MGRHTRSTNTLSRQQPLPSIETRMPWPRSRPVNALLVNWVDSIDRRNTSIMEVLNGTTQRVDRRADRANADVFTGRVQVNQRQTKQAFWKRIATGLSSEDAAQARGVSQPLGRRWLAACHP